MKEKIKEFFKEHNLPYPVTISLIGPWAKGECYAVTCGVFKIKKYCVYFINEEIHSVRKRG